MIKISKVELFLLIKADSIYAEDNATSAQAASLKLSFTPAIGPGLVKDLVRNPTGRLSLLGFEIGRGGLFNKGGKFFKKILKFGLNVVEERIEAPRMKGINDFWGKLSAPRVCPNFLESKTR
jgi:hypothetical protein